jgi:small-conductance mechanosensitive channel
MSDILTRLLGAPERIVYGNSLADWLLAGIVAVAAWSALSLLRRLIAARSKHYAIERHTVFVRLLFHVLSNTRQFFFLALAVYAGQQSLTLGPRIERIISNFVLVLLLVQVGLWAGRSLRFYLRINFVAGLLIWSLVVLLILENLGVNITALLAGLGVGGVAVALALQNILGDLFASLSIALDKPFVTGDYLTIDAFSGTVERIGIKTTRLRSESGEQIILSNADILKSRVRNYERMTEQRVLVTLRVAYATAPEKIAALPKLLEDIVRAQAHTRFERCHFISIGESSMRFELSYFVVEPRLHPMLDVQQAVNLRIIEEFRRVGIEFAYPTQRVVLESASQSG